MSPTSGKPTRSRGVSVPRSTPPSATSLVASDDGALGRAAFVESIRRSVADGTYHADCGVIADKLLDLLLPPAGGR
jgi:anti-sigma28 factor (negative regulator of flagellin synthesis)